MLEKWNASLFLDVMAKIKAEAGGGDHAGGPGGGRFHNVTAGIDKATLCQEIICFLNSS